MQQRQSLRVIEEGTEAEIGGDSAPSVETHAVTSHYEAADPFELGAYEYPVPGFVDSLFDTLGKDFAPEDAKLVDTIEPNEDIDDGLLVAFPDESLLFLGKDPTAKDAMPWYGFTIEPMEPIPAPETAEDALDLLKPPSVQNAIQEDAWIPNRHGEWWLLPTNLMPLGETFSPGVSSKPYGPSPLGNHVPREWGMTTKPSEFMDRFRAHVESAPQSIQTPPEAIEWTWRQTKKGSPPADAPSWAQIREWAETILVKGTIRHRDDDHFVENCGEVWHKAETHNVKVYTADALGQDVHLDYYGV